MPDARSSRNYLLLVGDALVLGIVTMAGFASHGTLGTAGQRMLTTFIPLLVSWILIAPHLRVFDREQLGDWRQLWRPFWAMVLAAPMAAFLRGAMLGSPILPIFVVVLGGISALALLAWRVVVWFVQSRRDSRHG
jgi:Protein of unknown function (DUF3054)